MSSKLLASAAFAALVLGAAGSASAAPMFGAGLTVNSSGSQIENVYWRRLCDRDGNDCHRVWVNPFRFYDRDDDRRWWRWNRDHDRRDHDRRDHDRR